jgi:hypothetical protein
MWKGIGNAVVPRGVMVNATRPLANLRVVLNAASRGRGEAGAVPESHGVGCHSSQIHSIIPAVGPRGDPAGARRTPPDATRSRRIIDGGGELPLRSGGLADSQENIDGRSIYRNISMGASQ